MSQQMQMGLGLNGSSEVIVRNVVPVSLCQSVVNSLQSSIIG